MDYKKSKAPNNTITWDTQKLSESTGNVYESVMIVGKRANQISVEMKEELNRKLQEFASYTDNLEEVFENREQIEISRFYERLPKAAALAVTEFMDGNVYFRNPSKEESNDIL
jgi:DNA-directed RNA polymerase subunit K/omega